MLATVVKNLLTSRTMERHSLLAVKYNIFALQWNITNNVLKFYHMSHKRYGDLVDFMADKDLVPNALIRVFKVRWVSSHR